MFSCFVFRGLLSSEWIFVFLGGGGGTDGSGEDLMQSVAYLIQSRFFVVVVVPS